MPTKTEGGVQYQKEDFAYTPSDNVSEWKLNISDATHVRAAVAALGPAGFRGNRVQIPAKDLADVKRKVLAAYKKFFPDNDVPPVLKSMEDAMGIFDKLLMAFFAMLSQCEMSDEEDESEDGAQDVELSDDTQIIKAMNEELQQGTFVVLEPDVVDLHGDTYSEDEVRKAAHNFWVYCQKAYIDHSTETQQAKIVENYTAPVDLLIDGRLVRKGTWLQVWQFNEDLWGKVKSGEYNGVSIGAYAKVEEA